MYRQFNLIFHFSEQKNVSSIKAETHDMLVDCLKDVPRLLQQMVMVQAVVVSAVPFRGIRRGQSCHFMKVLALAAEKVL